jgi:hypothetical protein
VARNDNPAQPAAGGWPLTTGEKERSRVVVVGRRADDGGRCTVVVIHERSGYWGVYPHGFATFGVRLPRGEAVKVAQAILDGTA